MMEKHGFDMNLISRHRNALLGLSAISIIVFHHSYDVWAAVQRGLLDPDGSFFYQTALQYYAWIRSVGVEIFLFLSGMGMYYSLSSNSDLRRFYSKRLSRVLVPYLICAGIFWFLRDICFRGEGFSDFISDLSFASFITEGNHTIWFVFLIMILYAVYPAVHKLFSDCQTRTRNYFILMEITILILCLFSHFAHGTFMTTNIASTRIPVFLTGCYAGMAIREHRVMPWKWAYLIIGASFAVKAVTAYMRLQAIPARLSAGVFSLGLLILLVIGMEKLSGSETGRKIYLFMTKAGKYSLELYLVHVCIRNLIKQTPFHTWEPQVLLFIVVLSVPLAIALESASSKVLGHMPSYHRLRVRVRLARVKIHALEKEMLFR